MNRPIPRGEARGRILETTWALIAHEGAAAATLSRVARETGVSRQAVYLFFGSRGGLLIETLRVHDAQSGIGRRLVRAAARRPAAAALGEVVAQWFGYIAEIEPVARSIEAAAVTDTDAAVAWAERMAALRSVFGAVVRRLDADDALAGGYTVRTATELAFATTQIAVWRALVVESGWSAAEAAATIGELLATRLVVGRAGENRDEGARGSLRASGVGSPPHSPAGR